MENYLEQNIWIGLVHVIPHHDCKILEQNEGAYTSALALAESPEELRAKIEKALEENRLKVIEFLAEDLLRNRVKESEVAPDILEMAEEKFTDDTVRFDTLHIYPRF